jgi:hypothetical protein
MCHWLIEESLIVSELMCKTEGKGMQRHDFIDYYSNL